MADLNAARRWASALIDLAAEAKVEEAIERDLREVVEAVTSEDGALLQALSSPVFEVAERKAVLERVLERVGAQPLTARFLKLLIDRTRIALLPEIAQVYREHTDERAGRIRVQVSTVEPLSASLVAELTQVFSKATGKHVVLDSRIDPSLIGGLVARIGGRVYDASLRTRLEDLKHRLIHTQAVPEA